MKTVLITGGSRGIGRAMVEAFSDAGYNVAFTYKKSKEAAKILSAKTGAYSICADSVSESDVSRAVDLVVNEFGNVDVLINNVGISHFGLLTDVSLDLWNEIMLTNVTGAFLYSKMIIPKMLTKKQGRIINVSSIWGITGASCEVAYSTSKAAIIGFTKALAKELGPSGITVNAIAPGVIATEMNSRLSDVDVAELKDSTPLMRIGSPSEVASAALFLAGDESSFITGEVLNVSGGFIV